MHRAPVILIALLLLLTACPARGAAGGAAAGGPTDPQELEAFLDPLFQRHLQEYHIPGAVFVAVRDGRILLLKGYGVADLERQTPVDPERTLFPIGSVTKLFTATAVMQVAEQGRLDLHTDVNRYLEAFQVPSTFPEPITAAHLLTHTAGFDDLPIGMAARTPEEVQPLGAYLAENLPDRIMPPGEAYLYSNQGMALAGHLVEAVTGRSYERYLTENILRPLGMAHTFIRVPPELQPQVATGYRYRGGQYVEQPPWHLNVSPAGDLRSTGADMARFMIAHLEEGRYGEARILRAETVREMHRQHFTHHPMLPGMAYGFHEWALGDLRVIEHGGDVAGASSQLMLVPEANWGFFVAYNAGGDGSGGSAARHALAEALLQRYQPEAFAPGPDPHAEAAPPAGPRAEDAPPAGAPADGAPPAEMARFTGRYRTLRYDRSSLAKVQVLAPEWSVTDNGDGTLTLRWPGDMLPPARLEPAGPLLFRQAHDGRYVAFGADADGRIHRLYLPYSSLAAERVPWYGQFRTNVGLLAGVVLLCLSAVLLWPGATLLRRIRQMPPPAPEVRRARWVGGGVAALILLLLTLMLAVVLPRSLELVFGLPPAVRAMLVLPWLSTALTAPMLWCAVRSWRSPAWTMGARLHYTAVTLGALLFIPFLWYWNLLGF